jgi:predicted phosphodiesterase
VPTAIVSDLHLGLASGRALLSRPSALRALAGALADANELVLLGDVVELRERPLAHVMAVARPTLEELGRSVAGKRVTIVPGNHDYQLAAPLVESLQMRDGGAAAPLGLETFADPPAAGPLAAVAGALGAERVRIAYPGLWVRPDVYATHGHYLDVHNTVPTFERIAIGAAQRVTGRLPDGPLTPDDYEAALGPVYALIYALAQSSRGDRSVAGSATSVRMWHALNSGRGRRGGRGGRGLSRRLPSLLIGSVALPAAVGALNRVGVGPLKPDLSGVELRRAGLRGMGETVRRLGIEADHVIFGHTHRSGPHPGDSEGWDLPGGGRLMNTGSWIHEPAFLGRSPRESPYWPGHVAMVPDEGPPVLLDLLDELP